LQQLRKRAEWAGWAGAGSGYLPLGFIHNRLMGFYPDHKSRLCKVNEPVAECAFFLAHLGVFAFFCKYSRRRRDRL